jgi:hypothetical protein
MGGFVKFTVADPFGPELILNGAFDDSTGWTLSRCQVDTGTLHLINSTGIAGNATYTTSGLTNGATYRVTFDLTEVTSVAVANYLVLLGSPTTTGTHVGNYTPPSVGAYSFDLVASANTEYIRFPCPDGSDIRIDNVSVREIL